MRNIKRNNWTNEEVISILKGCKISGPGGKQTEFTNTHNNAIDDVIDEFGSFMCDANEYHAMGYCPEEDMIYAIGPVLPRCPVDEDPNK